jgi:hypothetical protein
MVLLLTLREIGTTLRDVAEFLEGVLISER